MASMHKTHLLRGQDHTSFQRIILIDLQEFISLHLIPNIKYRQCHVKGSH